MKKFALLLFCLFLTLSTSSSYAGQTTLTTYYPPPVGAYNKFKLALNATLSTSTAAAFCTGNNNYAYFLVKNGSVYSEYQCKGKQITWSTYSLYNYCTSNPRAIFTDINGNLQQCKSSGGIFSSFCSSATNGTLIADTSGNLHVCINNQETIYPQQCYNKSCTYDPTATNYCPISCNQPGLTTQLIAGSNVFQTSATSETLSLVCCSGIPQGSKIPSSPCVNNSDCQSGVCTTNNKCGPNPPAGPCKTTNDCQSGDICFTPPGYNSSICTGSGYRGPNEPCTTNSPQQCGTNLTCSGGYCDAVCAGATCQLGDICCNGSCCSGICSNNVCSSSS